MPVEVDEAGHARSVAQRPPAFPRGPRAPSPLRARPAADTMGRMRRVLAFAALAAACSSSSGKPGATRPLHAEVREREKGLAVERSASEFTDDRPPPRPTEADLREFERVWALYAARSPEWPAERSRFQARGEACAYILAMFLLAHYHRVNAARANHPAELVRVRDEIVAAGAPCAPYLVDWMILDEIRVPALEKKAEGKPFLTDDITRQDCLEMLRRMGTQATPSVLRALARRDLGEKGRRFLALALGGTRDPRAYDPLVRMLREDPSWQVRADAAQALGDLGDRRALAPLREAATRDPDPFVVKRAGRAIAQLEGRRAR